MKATLAALLLLATPAFAGPAPAELAIEADAVHTAHCAEIAGAQVAAQAESNLAVAEAWKAVSDLGTGRPPGATWLQAPGRLHLKVGWFGGGGARVLDCTDDASSVEDGGNAINSACVGGPAKHSIVGPAAQAIGLEIAVYGQPRPLLGIGARAWITGLFTGDPLPEEGAPTLQGDVQVGFRLGPKHSPDSSPGARDLHLEIGAAATLGHIRPIAGNHKYGEQMGWLDPGTFGVFLPGIGVRVEGREALGGRAILVASARLAIYIPFPGDAVPRLDGGTPTLIDGQTESVQRDRRVVEAGRITGGGRIGLLFNAGRVAIGPSLGFVWHNATLGLEGDGFDTWCVSEPCANDRDRRKVFSTRRNDVLGTLGITLQLEAGQ